MKTFLIEIAKLGDSITLENLPEVSLDYATGYGLKQSINDAGASVVRKTWTGTDEEYIVAVREKCMERVDQLRNGTPPGSRAPASPQVVAARKMTAAAVSAGISEAEFAVMLAKMVADKSAAAAKNAKKAA